MANTFADARTSGALKTAAIEALIARPQEHATIVRAALKQPQCTGKLPVQLQRADRAIKELRGRGQTHLVKQKVTEIFKN